VRGSGSSTDRWNKELGGWLPGRDRGWLFEGTLSFKREHEQVPLFTSLDIQEGEALEKFSAKNKETPQNWIWKKGEKKKGYFIIIKYSSK